MINFSDIKFLVIHCTDSLRDKTTFEQVNFWHKNNGWKSERSGISIGYHFFIDGKGKIHQGRRIYDQEKVLEMGAAQYGINPFSIGICLALKKGEEPSKAQLSNLKTLLKKLMNQFDLPTELKDNKGKLIKGIIGHRDVSKILSNPKMATECPTNNLYNALQIIKVELSQEVKK